MEYRLKYAMNRILWEPAIYEHKASLIGRDVMDVANSAQLLVEAMEAEFEAYRADFMTVGLDLYNIEAQACGAQIVAGSPASCPEISNPLWDLSDLPDELHMPAIPHDGRFEMILQAGRGIVDKLGGQCSIRVGVSGPASIAAKLVGLEKLVMSLALGEEAAGRILEFSTQLALDWCRCLRLAGLDVVVFDSVASPPIVSPAMYRLSIGPLHKRVMSLLENLGQSERPLVMGGDTTAIVADLVDSGAGMIVCDFPAKAEKFAAELRAENQPHVRRNVDPSVLTGSDEDIALAARELLDDLQFFAKPIAGTGILPYDTDPQRVNMLRNFIKEL